MKIHFAIPMSYDWRYVDWRLRKLLWEEIESITQYKQIDIRIIFIFIVTLRKRTLRSMWTHLKVCRCRRYERISSRRFAFCHDENLSSLMQISFSAFYRITAIEANADRKINHHFVIRRKKFEFVVVTW